jgi:hypothetical protein
MGLMDKSATPWWVHLLLAGFVVLAGWGFAVLLLNTLCAGCMF